MTLLTDLQGAVQHRARRIHGGGSSPYERIGAALERADFEEQLLLAQDDSERVSLCQRWLKTYYLVWDAEGKEHDVRTNRSRLV